MAGVHQPADAVECIRASGLEREFNYFHVNHFTVPDEGLKRYGRMMAFGQGITDVGNARRTAQEQ
jgi:hypothetical protein